MMKQSKLLILTMICSLPLLSGCNLLQSFMNQNQGTNNNTNTSGGTGTNTGGNAGGNAGGSGNNEPKKITVAAHTLRDNNPPIDVDSIGEEVSESTWNYFRNASQSYFEDNYNYTYVAYSGGSFTVEAFTKNGYYVQSSAGRLYYERKSGSTFYQYSQTSGGYQRSTTTLDLANKCSYRIHHEIYVHMFEFENYFYDEDFEGLYRYLGNGFTSNVRFQDGYLTYLYYVVGSNTFEIRLSFETTIDIPESYYYQ